MLHLLHAAVAGSLATTVKALVGIVDNYFPKAGVALFKLDNRSLTQGCTIAFSGPTTGWLEIENAQLQVDDSTPSQILQGSVATLKVPSIERKNDKVFVILPRATDTNSR